MFYCYTDTMSGKKCSTPEDDIMFWMQLPEKLKTDVADTQKDFEEFQKSSRELEQELDTQLEQLENTKKDLKTNYAKLKKGLDSVKEKLEKFQGSSHYMITELNNELARVAAIKRMNYRNIKEC